MVEYRAFGRTGVQVSALALGAMNFGAWGNPDHDDSIRIINRALEAGINFIDTADVYSQGESEEIVGKALAGGRRDDIFLATKFHGQMGDERNHQGNSRRWIMRAVEDSLRRLRTDWIDLYQVHRPEPDTDFDETLGALSDLVHQGKIRYIGTSTFEPSSIVEGQWIAERRGRERVVSEQPPYSILVRGVEREMLPVAQRYSMAVIPWSPLAGGWLAGRYRPGHEPSKRAERIPARYNAENPANAGKIEAVDRLTALADEAGISLIHLALAFVLQHPAVTSAIIGPRTLDHLESQLGVDKVGRSADLWRYRELLPVRDDGAVTTLGEGWTPLLPAPRYGARIGVRNLLVKDEGLMPTGSFKARGAAVGVSRARELGIRHVAMPTNGNAGAAWAAYAARAGIRATIAMPKAAPTITRGECVAAGADLHLVDGLISDAGRIIADLVARGEVFDVSTLREPYRLEGKKTMGYEIVEQLGWRVPDVIVYPTGGGVGLIGIHKALGELRALGWLGDRMPRLVVVQATGCAPIVRAFEQGARRAEPWADAHTVAFGITVPAPLGDELILDALYGTGGTAIAVDDAELLADLRDFAVHEGLLLCPEGAAGLTAARRLRGTGWIAPDDEVVVLNTGAGLKYPDTIKDGGGRSGARPWHRAR